MAVKNWKNYLDDIQLTYLPISLVSLGVFLLFSISRDVVFSDFQPPTWLLILDLSSAGILAVAFLVSSMKWLRAADAKAFLFLCFVGVAFRPSIIVFFDGTPATLILCSVIFAISLLFFTLLHLLISQAIALVVWGVVVGEQITTAPYLVTLVLAFAAAGVGYWLQRTRLTHMKHNFELESRVEDLETIVPMCANCKCTRDEQGNWMTVEQYIESKQDSTLVSHGICPKCKEDLYGDVLRESPV